MKVRVVGLKVWCGELDGKRIKSGKVFAEVKLDDRRNNLEQWSKGVSIEEYRVDVEILQKFSELPLPFDAELVIERMSNGTKTREVVTDMVPVLASAKPPATQVRAAA